MSINKKNHINIKCSFLNNMLHSVKSKIFSVKLRGKLTNFYPMTIIFSDHENWIQYNPPAISIKQVGQQNNVEDDTMICLDNFNMDIMRINKKFSRYFQINLDISWKHFLFTFFIWVLVCLYLLIFSVSWSGAPRVPRLYLLIVPVSWSGAPRVPRLYLLIVPVPWSGAPRVPRLMMNQHNILPQTSEYNVTWTTDSFAPVTNYLLYYRKNKVKLRKKGKTIHCTNYQVRKSQLKKWYLNTLQS